MIHPKIGFDPDGYLAEPRRWNKTLAATIALRDGLDVLTPDHWEVIWSLREHFKEFGTTPDFEQVCSLNHLEEHCVDHLFNTPTEACRVAGLPNPEEQQAGVCG